MLRRSTFECFFAVVLFLFRGASSVVKIGKHRGKGKEYAIKMIRRNAVSDRRFHFFILSYEEYIYKDSFRSIEQRAVFLFQATQQFLFLQLSCFATKLSGKVTFKSVNAVAVCRTKFCWSASFPVEKVRL